MPELSTVWFAFAVLLLAGWSVLDGFDFGTGALHLFVARTDAERRTTLAAIGPVWDGNEVWLLAAGGTLFLAFPRVLAAGFSGLYLPVLFVVWALIVRGVSIELRSHLPSGLWRSFFDTAFAVSSIAVPVLMGAALGNVLRGVPLDERGFFELPLFATDGGLGALDGYTASTGVLTLVTLTAHGANWLAWKTAGEVHARATRLRRPLWIATAVLFVGVTGLTARVTPELVTGLGAHPLAIVGLLSAAGGLVVTLLPGRSERTSFLAGAAFIAGALVTAAASAFPIALRSTGGTGPSLTVFDAVATGRGPSVALGWWIPGMLLVAGYYWWVLRHFRGKVEPAADGEGY